MLGGSFNPAHEGHLLVSRAALKRLGLHEVWWLVAAQNPLKPSDGMLPLDDRLERAARFVRDRTIRVTGLERHLGTRFTADTVACLRRRAPRARFVWLMGADNLAALHRWRCWTGIPGRIPVAVFDRSPYSFSCLASPAAVRYRRARHPVCRARMLADMQPPAWILFPGSRNPASATAIRAGDRQFGFAGRD